MSSAAIVIQRMVAKIKARQNPGNFRSGGQLSPVGNTPNIIQNKFMYLHKSLIYKKFLYFPTNV